jgi:hypothetical protein
VQVLGQARPGARAGREASQDGEREAVEPPQTLVKPRQERTERHRRNGDQGRDRRQEQPQRRGELALGRYRLIERLGAGGFGVVWRAHDEQLGREVALKRIPLPAPEDSERAAREALATARLGHPAIVALYEACADEHAYYLISELVDGETLAQLIARDELVDEQIVEVGAAIAAALAHAHARGVVHRDVKPSNVIVVSEPIERRGIAKLADFGGAQLAGEDALTRTGDVLGTLAYMAPEQSEGEEVGDGADTYSLALVLYEALSGLHPVRGRTPAETARRIGRPIEPLARHRGDLPRELTRAIDAALHPDPRRRAPLAELRAALEDAARPASQPAGPTRAPPRDPGRVDEAERSRRWAIPGVAWLVGVIGLAIWQAATGRPGVSVLVLAAGAPLLVLARGGRLQWLGAALAPALGLAGLAGAFPALAGQGRRWRARAGAAALGWWWLALAEPLAGRRLWEGPALGTPARPAWEASPQSALAHVLGSLLTPGLAIGALVWAAAAVMLPWIVRGTSAALDVAAAIAWTVALLAAAPFASQGLGLHAAHGSPRGALLGAVLGCVLAVCARAVRGPV